MPKGRPVRVIGLTGGIATGKSTAARMFAQEGATVIDADQLARRVVEPGRAALEEIRSAFGDRVIGPDGRLDREALAARVFGDPEARERLNAIVHPRVEREVRRAMDAALEQDPTSLVVYDVPLLFESGIEESVDLIAVVYVPRGEQKRRLVSRDGLSPEDAEARIASQMDIEEKARRADVVLDNRGSVGALRRQVQDVVRWVRCENRKFRG